MLDKSAPILLSLVYIVYLDRLASLQEITQIESNHQPSIITVDEQHIYIGTP